MKNYHFDLIATGHNLDDRIGTFFIRLLRGGRFGLRSILPSEPQFIRLPSSFKKLKEKEIIEFLKDRVIPNYTYISWIYMCNLGEQLISFLNN